MKNIYIETDENFRVTKIHRMPFDPVNGMGYSREELEKKGFFVNEIPEPKNQIGKRSIAMYNPDTKSIYYEYVSVNLSDKERVEQLENAMNFIFMMRNALYGANPMKNLVLSPLLEEEKQDTVKLSVQEEGAAKYIANQVMSGKLDLEESLKMFPQFESVIKNTLKENGIQV